MKSNIAPKVAVFLFIASASCGAGVSIANALGKLKDFGWAITPLFVLAGASLMLAVYTVFFSKPDENAIFEAAVQTMMRRINKHYDNAQYRGDSVFPTVNPSPGDNLDVFNEALRRVKKERGPYVNPRPRG